MNMLVDASYRASGVLVADEWLVAHKEMREFIGSRRAAGAAMLRKSWGCRIMFMMLADRFTGVVLGAAQVPSAGSSRGDCQPPVEPKVREVKVALRAGGLDAKYLDEEFDRLKSKSSIRPSLPEDLAQGGYTEFMQETLAAWRDFMDFKPERDDRFEEGDRKSRGKITWKKRLRQLATIVQHGLQKEEIMSI